MLLIRNLYVCGGGKPCLICYSEVILRAGRGRHSRMVRGEETPVSSAIIVFLHSRLKQGLAIFKAGSTKI